MNRRIGLVAFLVAAAALVLTGCFDTLTSPKHENPLDPDNPDTQSRVPGKPTGLAAVVSDRQVALSWAMSDTTSVASYRVYRWQVVEGEEPADDDYELLDTVTLRACADDGVRNGQEYSYRVSAVNTLGLEGRPSLAVSVTPRVYGVSIEGGRAKTSTRDVTLTMSAVSTTQVMRVSSTPSMTGAPWVPFQASYDWELAAGDGVKAVYAQFRAADDSESEIVTDSITLDSQAVITLVTEDTDGQTLGVGDVIHFAITAGEPYGTAWVTLRSSVSGIVLYDDGTWGDPDAYDGVYERDYEIGHGVEVVQATVTGGFIDDVGNEAAAVLASGTVTIQTPPTAVTMAPPVALSKRSIALSWSRNNDPDLERYKLYRSYVPGVGVSTQRRLIADLAGAGETDFTDSGLAPDSTYYYAVYAVDAIGLSTISNEVVGWTLANDPPEPVTLYAPWAPDSTSLTLSWSRSGEDDFLEYEVIGWEQDPPDPPNVAGKRVLARIDAAGETFYTHSSLVDTLVYWYEVAVVDSFDARAVSNAVSGSPRPAAE